MTEDFWDVPVIPGPRSPGMWPPGNVIGAPIGENIILVRREDLVISLEYLTAFPTALLMHLVLRQRGGPSDGRSREAANALMSRRMGTGWRPKRIEPSRLRFGVGYSDGRRANNLWSDVAPNAQGGGGLVMGTLGGHSDASGGVQRIAVSPLPDGGPVTFACEWPARNVEFTRRVIDSEPILRAAEQAVVLWEPEWDPPSEAMLGP